MIHVFTRSLSLSRSLSPYVHVYIYINMTYLYTPCTGEAPDLGLPGCCLHGVEVQARGVKNAGPESLSSLKACACVRHGPHSTVARCCLWGIEIFST